MQYLIDITPEVDYLTQLAQDYGVDFSTMGESLDDPEDRQQEILETVLAFYRYMLGRYDTIPVVWFLTMIPIEAYQNSVYHLRTLINHQLLVLDNRFSEEYYYEMVDRHHTFVTLAQRPWITP